MLRKKSSWIGFGLAGLFLVLFLYRVDFGQLVQALKEANYLFLIPAVLVYFVGVWFRAVRWRLLLLSLSNIPPHRLFSPIVIGFAVNNILPARVGLVARIYLLGVRERISVIASGATVAVDQLFDGLALLFFLEVIAVVVPLPAWAKAIALAAAALFLTFLGIFLMLAIWPRHARRLAGKVAGRFPQKWQPRISHGVDMALEGLASLRRPDRLALAFLLSLLVWSTEAAMYYIVSLSFGLAQPYHVLLLMASIANIAITLPSLPGGIGPFEFFGKQTLTLFAVPEGVAAAYVGVVHVVLLLPVTIVGLTMLAWRRVSLAEATGRGQVAR